MDLSFIDPIEAEKFPQAPTNGHPSVSPVSVGTSRLDVVVLVIQQQVKLGQDPEIGAKNNMALEPIVLSLGWKRCFVARKMMVGFFGNQKIWR